MMGNRIPLLWNEMFRYVMWDTESGRSSLRSKPAGGVKVRGVAQRTLSGNLAFYYDPVLHEPFVQHRKVRISVNSTMDVTLKVSPGYKVLTVSADVGRIRVCDLNDWPLRDPMSGDYLERLHVRLTEGVDLKEVEEFWGD